MATITISSSENIMFESGSQLPINITVGTSVLGLEARIDGFLVDQKGVASATIAVGNIIRGVLNGRYIIAEVTALPYTTESNLKFYIQTQ